MSSLTPDLPSITPTAHVRAREDTWTDSTARLGAPQSLCSDDRSDMAPQLRVPAVDTAVPGSGGRAVFVDR